MTSTALVRRSTPPKPSLLTRVAQAFSALTRTVSVSSGPRGWSIVRGTTPSDFQGTGSEVRRHGWERHPVVHACIRAIVDLVAAVPLEIYRQSANESFIIPDHEALALFRGDNGRQSEYRLKARLTTHFLTYGNAFAVLERRGRRGTLPTRLRIVQPKVPPAEWTVTALEPGRGFRIVSRSPGATVEANHWIEPAGSGNRSRVTLSVTFGGFLGTVIGWVMRGLNQRYIAQEADGLKRRSEERAHSG